MDNLLAAFLFITAFISAILLIYRSRTENHLNQLLPMAFVRFYLGIAYALIIFVPMETSLSRNLVRMGLAALLLIETIYRIVDILEGRKNARNNAASY
jgi:uncharacterized membrane protein HdeD (DUF308 family)